MSKKNIIITVGFVLLICLNVFWVSNTLKLKKASLTLEHGLNQKVQSYERQLVSQSQDVKSLLFGTVLSKQSKTRILSDYPEFVKSLNTGDKLIFFYPKGACISCLTKIYTDLESLAIDIGKENIITISEKRVLDNGLFKPSHFELHEIKSLELEIEKLNQPFLFIMDNDLDVKHVYIPELYDSFRQEYFSDFLVNYFGHKN